jgi:hypothetical protein
MDDKMTIDNALNIANVANDCLADHGDQDVRELAIAAKGSRKNKFTDGVR